MWKVRLLLEELLQRGKISREEFEKFLNEPFRGFGYLLNRLVEEGKLTLQEAEKYFNNYRGRGWGRGFGRGRSWGRGFGRGWGRGWRHRLGWGW